MYGLVGEFGNMQKHICLTLIGVLICSARPTANLPHVACPQHFRYIKLHFKFNICISENLTLMYGFFRAGTSPHL